MKKISLLCVCFVLCFVIAGCGSASDVGSDSTENTEASEGTSVANPVHTGTLDDVMAATGIALEEPQGATDAEYSYIESGDEDSAIAQVTFTLDGNQYCYRAKSVGNLSIMDQTDENAEAKELVEMLKDGTNIGAALSGLYEEWSASATTVISYCDGIVAFNDGDSGFIAWLDVVPGILYSLSMDDGADQDLLQETAELVFEPVQGDD